MSDKKQDGTSDDADARPTGTDGSGVPEDTGTDPTASETDPNAPDAERAGADAPPSEGRPVAEDPLGEPRSELSAEPASEPQEPAPDPLLATESTARETHDEQLEDVQEDDGGWSFAARALTFLILLFAGAALGIWAAPRIAPQLPSGMAPVAQWLTPGNVGDEEEIAALNAAVTEVQSQVSSLSDRVNGLSASLGEGDVASRIAQAVQQARSQTEDELADVREQIAGLSGDEVDQRLARLESTLEGQVAELSSLQRQIAGSISSEATEQAAEQINVYEAQIEGLRAELGSVSDAVASLRNRIDEVAATADRSIETAQEQVEQIQTETRTALSNAAIESDVALIRAALAAGQPFSEPATRLAEDPGVSLPEGLRAAADTGAPTLLTLQDRFPDAAHTAIRASIAAGSGEGLLARSRAFIEAQVASRSLTPQEGDHTDAILSRMEEDLRNGDLPAALSEAEALPSEARAAMRSWLDDAQLRAQAEAGLAQLRSSTPATN